MEKKPVQISECGKRMGETHGRAKLTDHEIDLVRELKEQGMPAAEIAEKFEISKRYVYKLVNCERRACVVTEYRTRKPPRIKGNSERSGPDVVSCGLSEASGLNQDEARSLHGDREMSVLRDLPDARKRKGGAC